MAKFVGRERELQTLQEQYEAPHSTLVPIYGRRRIGKTELILHFSQRKPCLYFMAKEAAAKLNFEEFRQAAAETLREPLLCRVDSWPELLREIGLRWKGSSKLIVVLDEYQWAVQSSPELSSILQAEWDLRWQRSGQIMLVLCGSQIGFMEEEIHGANRPLFGRKTCDLRMHSFDYRQSALFLPAASVEEKAMAHFLTGGVAAYLQLLNPQQSIEQNVLRLLLHEHGALVREPDFLLRLELRDVAVYYSILQAIAEGSRRFKDIAAQLAINAHSLHFYLTRLESLGYILKRYPLTGRLPNKREICYEIADALLRFWFRFIHANEAKIRRLGAERAFIELIRPQLPAFWGGCFERFCRQNLPEIYLKQDKLICSFQVGEYWDKQVQIDVVGIRDDHWTDLGECRWGSVRSLPGLVKELDEKVNRYPNSLNHSIRRHLFLRSLGRKAGRIPDVQVHLLADFYR